MAAYFAFETLARALMHLVVGLVMGAALGIVGGTIGRGPSMARRLLLAGRKD